MLNACRHVGMPAGVPNPRKAYHEACTKLSPKVNQHWSHPAVYLAGRDSGWHMLANEIESKALPVFSDIYQQYCDRILAGERFIIDTFSEVAELELLPATKKYNQQQVKNLKRLLD